MTRPPPPVDPRRIVVPIFRARQDKQATFQAEPVADRPSARRPARVAYMLALAIRVERMIASGELRDRAHAAANLGFTRARVTQLLALALLAPDIQEEILFLMAEGGAERITERTLRDVVAVDDWSEQRRRWTALCLRTRRA